MTIKEMVESYAKSYEGMLPPEAIERAKTFWRDELTKAYTLGQKDKEREVVDVIHKHLREAPLEIQMTKGAIFADVIKDITTFTSTDNN